jgi:hypothetical protein
MAITILVSSNAPKEILDGVERSLLDQICAELIKLKGKAKVERRLPLLVLRVDFGAPTKKQLDHWLVVGLARTEGEQ